MESPDSFSDAEGRIFCCQACHSLVARQEDLMSKAFQGRHGRAYLFHAVFNVTVGKPDDRMLLTGLHTVADITCNICGSVVGWKYEKAFEASQKYKEGRFIVEMGRLIEDSGW